MPNILITGGAGFIGSRLALSLSAAGHSVGVLDSMHPQVHSNPDKTIATLASANVAVRIGDVRDPAALRDAILGLRATTVVHLAAETGTGQSFDIPAHYCDVNVTGTAHLVETIRSLRVDGLNVDRVLLAGSRAVYGEGACLTNDGRVVTAVSRLSVDLAAGDFVPKDTDGRPLEPIASSATTTVPAPTSVYATTKLMQEYLLRQALDPTQVEVGILRLQNVYGAGQSLHNPYTGVLSIFAQQLLEGKTLNIYEDGEIVRDFVYVSDVVAAFHRLCEIERVPSTTLDIGSGTGSTILEVARTMMQTLGIEANRLKITGQFRPGDIRHAVADISAAQDAIGWVPKVNLREGVAALIDWARKAT